PCARRKRNGWRKCSICWAICSNMCRLSGFVAIWTRLRRISPIKVSKTIFKITKQRTQNETERGLFTARSRRQQHCGARRQGGTGFRRYADVKPRRRIYLESVKRGHHRRKNRPGGARRLRNRRSDRAARHPRFFGKDA